MARHEACFVGSEQKQVLMHQQSQLESCYGFSLPVPSHMPGARADFKFLEARAAPG